MDVVSGGQGELGAELLGDGDGSGEDDVLRMRPVAAQGRGIPDGVPGELIVTTRRVLWGTPCVNRDGRGKDRVSDTREVSAMSIPFPEIFLHAVSRDASSADGPCIYLQIGEECAEVRFFLPQDQTTVDATRMRRNPEEEVKSGCTDRNGDDDDPLNMIFNAMSLAAGLPENRTGGSSCEDDGNGFEGSPGAWGMECAHDDESVGADVDGLGVPIEGAAETIQRLERLLIESDQNPNSAADLENDDHESGRFDDADSSEGGP